MNTHTKTNETNATAVTNQLFHLMHRAGQAGDDLFLKSFRDHRLTPRRYAVLNAAQNRDTPSQADLVADTGIDRSTLADIVGRLVDKGLVERQRTKRDARAYAITVTDKGHATIADLAPRLATMEQAVLAALPEDDRATFVRRLSRVVDALNQLGLS